MKVLLIHGSPRRQGNTYVALNEVAKQFERHGIESEWVWIGNKPLRGCIPTTDRPERESPCLWMNFIR